MHTISSQYAHSPQSGLLHETWQESLQEVDKLRTELELRFQRRTAELSKANDLLAIRNQELQQRAAETEAANKELESFAHAVSHDLRSPLRVISGFSQMLSEDFRTRLDERGRQNLDGIQSECSRMSQIIEDLLTLSKVSEEKLIHETVDLSELAASIAEHLREREPARQVHFSITPNLIVRGDSGLLEIALENLVGNAWKFTSRRPVARIQLGKLESATQTTYFVRDDGVGFDRDRAPELFRPFQRLHSDRDFEGTGVGLATVQRIIRRHGGRLWADGEVEKGATFYFTLTDVKDLLWG